MIGPSIRYAKENQGGVYMEPRMEYIGTPPVFSRYEQLD